MIASHNARPERVASRRRVLVVIDWFLPAYKAGGPVRSMANMVTALAPEVDFSIVTGDRDAGDTAPFPGIEPGGWIHRDGYRVCYLPRDATGARGLHRLLASDEFDVVHVNGMFSPHFSILPVVLKRLGRTRARWIVAPRGMLAAAALDIKRGRKSSYLTAARVSGLYRDVVWHATSDAEVEQIRAMFGRDARVELAPNLPNRVGAVAAPRDKAPGTARFCFFSRISPVKRVRELLEYFRSLPASATVTLDLVGPVTDQAYWASCRPALDALAERIEVTYRGAVAANDVPRVLGEYHFMVLPTSSESFGHAIIDALAAGCPVVTSDRTPWNGLADAGAGWVISLEDRRGFEAQLRRCVDMGFEEYARHSRAAAEMARQISTDDDAVARSRALFA